MRIRTLMASAMLAFGASAAQASLIGDTVGVEYHFSTLGTIVESESVVVEAGAGDTVRFFNSVDQVDVNVEAEHIQIDWLISPNFQPGAFNGIVITDMDWVGAPGEIVGLDVTTTAQGWDDSFATFTADSVQINYAPLGSVAQFSMRVDLITRHRQELPEPSALGMLALSAAGVGFVRRRRSQR